MLRLGIAVVRTFTRSLTCANPGNAMHGLIGRITALEGRRDELARILLEAIGGMPGCLSYVVAIDPQTADALWITEVWDSAESHRASLALPAVRNAIARGKPLIASFDQHIQTAVLGGHGLGGA